MSDTDKKVTGKKSQEGGHGISYKNWREVECSTKWAAPRGRPPERELTQCGRFPEDHSIHNTMEEKFTP